jgi:hypothetical protein
MKRTFNATEKRKFDNPWRYLYALIIAIFLLGFGFMGAYAVDSFQYKRISSLQDNTFYDFYSKQIEHELLGQNVCNQEYLNQIGESLDFQGSIIQKLEMDLSKSNQEIQDTKRFYFMMQLSHLNLMKDLNDECNFSNNFILFFYSNDKKEIDESERMGRLLNYLKTENENLLVYSFDTNSKDALVSKLIDQYNLTEPITIVVNEETKINNFKKISEIEQYLN